jgi:protein-tyrosine phosphatase
VSGYIDLHVHFVPGVDDGARTHDDALAMCRELGAIGFEQLVATPHMRLGMFDNSRARLEIAFGAFHAEASQVPGVPLLGLASEQHCDSGLADGLLGGSLLPYPGQKAILLEFGYEAFPFSVEKILHRVALKGLRPVLAHPERYVPLFKHTDGLDPLLDLDVAMQLDLLSLVGKYGKAAQRAAERMLEEGVYSVAASDAHGVQDVPLVATAIARLFALVGPDEATTLLGENPRRLLAGEATL